MLQGMCWIFDNTEGTSVVRVYAEIGNEKMKLEKKAS